MFRVISQFVIKYPKLCTIMTASGIYGAWSYSQLGKTRAERSVNYTEQYELDSIRIPMMMLMPPIMVPFYIGENIHHRINSCFVSNYEIDFYYKKRKYLRHISYYNCNNKCIDHDIDDKYRCINSECDCVGSCNTCHKKLFLCNCIRVCTTCGKTSCKCPFIFW
jgi:hypothetical protein